MSRLGIVLSACCLLLMAQGAGAAAGPLKKARFIPQWVPQAQFAGYYVALEKGMYRKHGLDLTIIPGGPHNPPLDLLQRGEADFATLWLASAIQARAQGLRLLHISQIVQRSAQMLVARRSSGIARPEDMEGKKVGLWGPIFRVQPTAFFNKYGVRFKVVPQSYSVNLFLQGGVDVVSAMWYNEYHTLLNCGLNPDELTTFFFHEHGLNFPEDGLYAMEETCQRDPELCRAFVKGSIEGWQYAFTHEEEALTMVMRNLEREHVPATRVHQRWMLERMKDLISPKDAPIPMGTLQAEDYHRVAMALHEEGLIQAVPDLTAFHWKGDGHAEQ